MPGDGDSVVSTAGGAQDAAVGENQQQQVR